MAIPFPTPPTATAEEAFFAKLGLHYRRRPDGVLVVTGDIHLYNEDRTELPDLSKVMLVGNFFCHENRLTSLKGAPFSVSGNFTCYGNELTSLEGAPKYVGGWFHCHRNKLASLQHMPDFIGGDVWCHANRLTSLDHAPETVTGTFYCQQNHLSSLEWAPWSFKRLISDFGTYDVWRDVPEDIRLSAETKDRQARAREAEKREKAETAVRKATELQNAIPISAPLRLKKPPVP